MMRATKLERGQLVRVWDGVVIMLQHIAFYPRVP